MEVLARKENTVYLQRKVLRGEVYLVDLSGVIGSEQGGIRPCAIIQNDIGNKYSPTVIISALTSQIGKAKLPTHINISGSKYGLEKDSVLLLEQVRTVDKKRLIKYLCNLDSIDVSNMNKAIMISLGLEIPVARTNNKVMNG